MKFPFFLNSIITSSSFGQACCDCVYRGESAKAYCQSEARKRRDSDNERNPRWKTRTGKLN